MSKTCHYHHHHHFRSWHSGCVGQALISAQPLLERRPRGASDCKTLQCLLPHSIPPLSLFSLYPHPNWQMLQMISNLYDNNNKDTPRTHQGHTLDSTRSSPHMPEIPAMPSSLISLSEIAPLTIAIYSQLILIVEFIISSVRSSNSHPDLLLTHHHPTFLDHTGPQHWTFTFWATTAI